MASSAQNSAARQRSQRDRLQRLRMASPVLSSPDNASDFPLVPAVQVAVPVSTLDGGREGVETRSSASFLPPTVLAEPTAQDQTAYAFAGLMARGERPKACAEVLGLDFNQIQEVLLRPDLQTMIREQLPQVEDIRAQLIASGSVAAKVVVDLMTSAPSCEERGRNARDILDRIGLAPIRKVQTSTLHLEERKMKLIRGTLRELVEASIVNEMDNEGESNE